MAKDDPKVYTALLVENDPAQRAIITLGLNRLGCQVTCAKGPAEVEELLSRRPDLLVMDTYLPQVNGIDLLRQFKADHLIDDCVVVMISSFGFGEVVQQAIQAGAHDFLIKPIDVDVLIQRSRFLLERFGKRGDPLTHNQGIGS
jgi:DNA-binding response OmpR family regulator